MFASSETSEIAPDDTLPPGTLLDEGRYRIEGVLGQGGFGITYAARDGASGREVAIKEFLPAGCRREGESILPPANREAWERGLQVFGRSAQTMSKLRHPALMRVYEQFANNDTCYAVMERLHGQTLQERVEDGPLSETEALGIAEQLAGALDALHRTGLLHLDIKPENVMLCPSDGKGEASAGGGPFAPRVVLFDFDLLQEAARVNDARTRPLGPAYCGTPGYAPLEQYSQNAPLSYATDVYALGATFYYLLTGNPPPAATDRALGAELRTPREIQPNLSRPAHTAALRALELQPLDRPRDAATFLTLLRGEAPPVVPPPRKAAAPAPQPIVAPQLGAEDWLLLASLTDAPAFPDVCACCGNPATTDWLLREAGREWCVPYCARCRRHVNNDLMVARGAKWGMIGSFGAAIAGVGLTLTDASLVGLLLTPSAVVAFFTAMAYGALKGQVCDAQMRPACTCRTVAVAYGGQNAASGPHLWKFKSQAYAQSFARENGANIVPLS